MVLSVSPEGTTLWDQFSYSGAPESFAWVLPTKGIVEVGLSSDALFQTLEGLTQVSISSPIINCPPPPSCGIDSPSSADSGGTGGGGPPVQVIAQETVGPFETVQLSSNDPDALYDWLQTHNYFVPQDLEPVIADYVAEGFNFLALKLVPGQGVDAMRPVRVTTPGAGATLPLRMVAGGTGPVTPITLWMLGEGRYEPVNFPSFQIDQSSLLWNWDESRSNYAELKQIGYNATSGRGWLIEAGEPVSTYSIEYTLTDLVNYDQEESGYTGDPAKGVTPIDELMADLGKLYGGISPDQAWISRMTGELTREALDDDLDLGASPDQSFVPRYFEAQVSIGTPPACPSFPPCSPWEGGGTGSDLDAPAADDIWGARGGCSMGTGSGSSIVLGGLALAAALAFSRRRRRS
ncbi:Hypothetical protein CAP_5633 [Chondromyces apiculatus DSM 436]|uniref:DUF2330 domain-containing protein n=2 Tax=Chondromyces apiculatus TaxID=51 RepID=A0A017T2S0_9BACT|nr:Hypothetical protein CAP_5633 [Chondromyces apiculatus DSM 436]